MSLKEYQEKRQFGRTSEPSPESNYGAGEVLL
jgi:hypothetical protein